MDVTGGRGGTPVGVSEVETALLDLDGVIVSANQAWYDFCLDNGGDIARCGVGSSYLEACTAAGADADANAVLDAIRWALAGHIAAPITLQIPCDAPNQPRWFDLLVSSRPDADGRCIGATVSLSPSKPSRKPIDHPDASPSAEVQFPDRPRLAMEGLVAELTERVQEVVSAQARLHALLRANASLAAETDLGALLDLIIDCGRELTNARTATLVPVGADVSESARQTASIGLSATDETCSDGTSTGASLTVPISVNSDLFATLVLDDSPNGRFSREDQWLANEFAANAGSAIRNALLAADCDRRQRWQRALADATRELLAACPDQRLEVTCRFAAVGAGAEAAAICAPVGSNGTSAVDTVAAYGSPAQLDSAIIADALRGDAPVFDRSLLLAPLVTDDVDARSAIIVTRPSTDRPFEQADLDQLALFAHQIAFVISLRVAGG